MEKKKRVGSEALASGPVAMENGIRVPTPTTILTAVAVDRDKSSQQAVKWTVDHLLVSNHTAILIHVRGRQPVHHGFSMVESTTDATKEEIEAEAAQLFMPYRGFCHRKGIHMKEVILEDNDISKAIVDYIAANHIHNIVVGSSNRNPLTRKFRNTDVATNIIRMAPEFCAVYVIAKGKPTTIRSAKGPAPATALPPKQPITILSHDHDDAIRTPLLRGVWNTPAAPHPMPMPMPMQTPDRLSFEKNVADRKSFDRGADHMKPPPIRDRPRTGNSLDLSSHRPLRRSVARDSLTDDIDFHGGFGFQSSESSNTFSISSTSSGSPEFQSSPLSDNRDMEAEMKRLKLELKQTMDMYSSACKEAITAKQKAKELHLWKMEEERRTEELRQAEEAAMALAETEKARCKAAMEAAAAAQKMAEIEAMKRKSAELKANQEAKEKMKALDALAHTDFRYRKYTIEEIEIATEYFSESLKIGEGGYGPVYRASLDHTPVAIKVLRPDAAQGKRQFQQEVEVLCTIRHPNMVLLLGACPDYGCLVYEYMDHGSLEDRLFCRGGTPPIPWPARFKIAAEIATALLFLHQAKPEPLVHRDLKPGNILLDRNYVSKISDVGLSRLVPASVADSVTQYRMTSAAGTFCYIDPEYQQTGMLGIKSDVYSLGVLLLQIVTARPPMGLSHHVERAIQRGAFGDMLDRTAGAWPREEAEGFARIALKCAEMRRKDRPDLGTVVLPELNRLRNLGHEFAAARSSGDDRWRENSSGEMENSRMGVPWRLATDAVEG